MLQTAKGISNLPCKKPVKFRLARVEVKRLKLVAIYFPKEDFHFIISHKNNNREQAMKLTAIEIW